jgi:ABC-type multidrug transport system permease subunit
VALHIFGTMSRIKFIFSQLSSLDLLLICMLSLSIVSLDLLTFHYIPDSEIITSHHYYGFPLPYEKCLPWADNLQKTIYLGPFILDLIFYFIITTLVYWFMFRYAFYIKLKMRFFIPLIFGMLFIILIPYILPGQEYELWLNNFNTVNYEINFNWYGHSKLH